MKFPLRTAIFMHNFAIAFHQTSHFVSFWDHQTLPKGLHRNANLRWNESRLHVPEIVFMNAVNLWKCMYWSGVWCLSWIDRTCQEDKCRFHLVDETSRTWHNELLTAKETQLTHALIIEFNVRWKRDLLNI